MFTQLIWHECVEEDTTDCGVSLRGDRIGRSVVGGQKSILIESVTKTTTEAFGKIGGGAKPEEK